MDYGSLFQTSFTNLRQNKLAWLFSLFILLADVNFFSLLPKVLLALSCCLSLISSYLILSGELGVLLALYHGYLGQTVNFRELWKEINSYIIRVFGIFFLCILLLIIPVGLFYLVVKRLPYILYEAIFFIPLFFYFTFIYTYLQLGMFMKKLDLKYALGVWSYNRVAKLVIALLFTFTIILFSFLLPAVIQKGFSINILFMSYQDFFPIQNLLLPRILQVLYSWITFPITTAIVVSFYFMDLEAKEGVPQSAPQAG